MAMMASGHHYDGREYRGPSGDGRIYPSSSLDSSSHRFYNQPAPMYEYTGKPLGGQSSGRDRRHHDGRGQVVAAQPRSAHADSSYALVRSVAPVKAKGWDDAGRRIQVHGAVPYWEDVYRRSLPVANYHTRSPAEDSVVGYLEVVEVTDISPSSEFQRVMITVEPLEHPGQFDTTCGPFKLEQMKAMMFQKARCHDEEIILEPKLIAMKGYVQALRVRVRVHYCPQSDRLRSEDDLVFIGATEAIEISWHAQRNVYHLRGLDGNVTGSIYMSSLLRHRSDIHHGKGEASKAILGKTEYNGQPIDVYTHNFLKELKELRPESMRNHAVALHRLLSETHRGGYEPVPNEDGEILKWILKVQGNVLAPCMEDQAHHEIIVQVVSSNLRNAQHSSFTDVVGQAGAKVVVTIETSHSKSTEKQISVINKEWHRETDVSPFRKTQDTIWKTKFTAQAKIKTDTIRFDVYEHHPTGDTLLGSGSLKCTEYNNGFDSNVEIKPASKNHSSHPSFLLRVKVSIGRSLAAGGNKHDSHLWRGNQLEPGHHHQNLEHPQHLRQHPQHHLQHPQQYPRTYGSQSPPQHSAYAPQYRQPHAYASGRGGYPLNQSVSPGSGRHMGAVHDRYNIGVSEVETISRRRISGNQDVGHGYPMDHGRQPSMYGGHEQSMRDSTYESQGRRTQAEQDFGDSRRRRAGTVEQDAYEEDAFYPNNMSRSRDDEDMYGQQMTQQQSGTRRDRHRDNDPHDQGHSKQLGADTKSASWIGSALGTVTGLVSSFRAESHDSVEPRTERPNSPSRDSRDRHMPQEAFSDQAPSKGAKNEYSDDEGQTSFPPLQVHIICADNLRIADFMGKSDPYVKVELRGQNGVTKGKVKETNYKEQTLEPVWQEVKEFKKYELGDELFFEVWDKDFLPFNPDDLLGKAHLSANAIVHAFGDPDGDWIELKEAGDTEGKARIKVRVVPPPIVDHRS